MPPVETVEPGPASPHGSFTSADAHAAAGSFRRLNEYPYERLSKLQETQVEQLRDLVRNVHLSPSMQQEAQESPDVFYTRYLQAKKWNVDSAAMMIEDTAKWRLDNKLDSQPNFPPAVQMRGWNWKELADFEKNGIREPNDIDRTEAALRSACSQGWHKADKQGRPIFIDRAGLLRPKEMVQRTDELTRPGQDKSQCLRAAHIHNNEVGTTLIRFQNSHRPTGAPRVVDCLIIVDAKGASFGHLYKPLMDMTKPNTSLDQKYYPDMIYMVYVVNAPPVVYAIWNVLKRWIDPRSQRKIKLVKPKDTAAKLLELVDSDNLPDFLGGTCHCDGGCTREMVDPSAEDATASPTDSVLARTKTFEVPKGEEKSIEHPVKSGETIFWEYSVKLRHIVFQPFFQAATATEPEPIAMGSPTGPAPKTRSGSGSFTVPADGTMFFKFDNTKAWMHSKTVSLLITSDVDYGASMRSVTSIL